MTTSTHCPHCSATLPTPAPAHCPLCQHALAAATPTTADGGGEGAAWWLGGAAPPENGGGTATIPAPVSPAAVVTQPTPAPASTPRLELPPAPLPAPAPVDFLRKAPEPQPPVVAAHAAVVLPPAPEEGAPWGGLAILLGVVAFGLAWVPRLGYFGVALGGLGLAIGLLGALVLRRRPGYGVALAGAVLSLQSVLFASAVVYDFVRPFEKSAKGPPTEIDKPPLAGPIRTVVVINTEDLLEMFKSKDAEARKKAIESLAGMARGVADAVPALTDRLLSDDDARVRAGFAAALGELGPQARSAYPALLHVQLNDGAPSVTEAATTAIEKIGKPSSFDVPFIVQGLTDQRDGYRASVAQTLSWICTPDNRASAESLRLALSVSDPDPRVKLYVAQALWAIDRQPREVMHVFRAALHDDDPAIRYGAAQSLLYLGQEAKVAKPDLRARLLKIDETVQVKLYAAQVLWYLDPDKDTAELVVPVLGKILKAKDTKCRADAAAVLVTIGPHATAALGDLMDALDEPSNDPDQRARCARALGMMGPEAAAAVKVLAKLLSTGGGPLSEQAAWALRSIGPKAEAALPELTAALRDRDIRVRGQAAITLAALGDRARSAVPALAAALETNNDPNIRVFLAQALWAVDRQQALALPVLLDLAQDANLLREIRVAALNVLAAMGPAAQLAQPTLLRVQEEKDDRLVKTAAAAAERIGPLTGEDVPELVKGFDAKSLTIRKAAAETLLLLHANPDVAVPALRKAFGDNKDLGVRLAAAKALGEYRTEARTATTELAAALKEQTPELQGTVLEALGKIGADPKDAKDVLPKVLALAADKEVKIRGPALWAAAVISDRDPALHTALEGGMKDKDGRIRVLAAGLYFHVKRNTELVLPVLVEALNDPDPEAEVKIAALNVLGSMEKEAQSTGARLTVLSKDKNEAVRKAALEALRKIGPAPPP